MSSRTKDSAPVSGAVHRAIFEPLAHTDAASAVVRRLRSAIGVGLLADGERLPREADLASHLGVTVFSLREALSVLRDEGLIVTRAGKNGGSFAQTPQDPKPIAATMLAQLSTSELVDLGDWRSMLTSQGAALSAERASGSNISRLANFAEQVAKAPGAPEARNAFGRFHLELAASAQSARLTRAELTMNEEFNLLVTLLLDDPAAREQCAATLRAIVIEIKKHNADKARRQAFASQSALISQLVKLRLTHLAADVAGEPVSSLTTAVNYFSKSVTSRLSALADVLGAGLLGSASAAETSAVVRREIVSGLGEIGEVLHGLGVIADVNVVPENPYWIDWWHRGPDGGFQRDPSHIMDAGHADFYDYTQREFMTQPKASGGPWAMGPYVDYGGVDDYVVTISTPICAGQQFLGVVAADFRVSDLERHFAPALARADASTFVVNSESRVVLSNSADRIVGSIVPRQNRRTTHPLRDFGWTIATPED